MKIDEAQLKREYQAHLTGYTNWIGSLVRNADVFERRGQIELQKACIARINQLVIERNKYINRELEYQQQA